MEAMDFFLTVLGNAILRWLLFFLTSLSVLLYFYVQNIHIHKINKEVSVENKSLSSEDKMTLNWQLYRGFDTFD